MRLALMATALTDNRIFGLDVQTVVDTVITLIAIFALFLLLSYLLFKPARKLMQDRQAFIQGQLDEAAKVEEDARKNKELYEEKMAHIEAQAQEVLSESRKKAKMKESEIVGEAQDEAARIRARAEKEIELERNKVQTEMKHEMIEVATLMAGRFVEESLDAEKQEKLVDETLEKLGDEIWQN